MKAAAVAAVLLSASLHAATVVGTLHTKGGTVPSEIVVRAGESVNVVCPVHDAQFTCTLPSGIVDLRLEARGFAPHYRFAVDLTLGRLDLGQLVLTRGASVSGWVREGDRDAGEDVMVTLTGQAADVEDPKTRAARSRTTKANAQGFFQFTDVAPGDYDLSAEKKQRSPARLSGVRVHAAREEVLRDPLVLRPLATLDVVIQPAVGPQAEPWTVALARMIPYSTSYEPVKEGRAGEDGRWSASALEEAAYVLDIRDTSGTEFSHQRVDVRGEAPAVVITLDVVPIRGSIRIGDELLEAHLKLTTSGGEEAQFQSDGEGRFRGVIGREGSWRSQVRLRNGQTILGPTVRIRRRDGEDFANVDLELPDGRIAGKVVDEEGKGVARAGVIVTQDGAPVVDVLSADDGAFELVGLRRASAMISAQALGAESGALAMIVGDGTSPVTLTLRSSVTVEGRLLTTNGLPVAGARIVYFAATMQSRPQAHSSPSGAFHLKLPGGTTRFDLAIVAPGLPIKLMTASVPDEGQRLEVMVAEGGARLFIKPAGAALPSLIRNGIVAPLQTLLTPPFGGTLPPEFTPDGIELRVEPGRYAVCADVARPETCVQALAAPGTTTSIALKGSR